jgi:hypothetical protein
MMALPGTNPLVSRDEGGFSWHRHPVSVLYGDLFWTDKSA